MARKGEVPNSWRYQEIGVRIPAWAFIIKMKCPKCTNNREFNAVIQQNNINLKIITKEMLDNESVGIA